MSFWVGGPVLGRFATPVGAFGGRLDPSSLCLGWPSSYFLQPEVTKEDPTRETLILTGSSMEGKASKAERELLEEPWPWGALTLGSLDLEDT